MHIQPLHPTFVGEVSAIDISLPLTADQVAAIEAGMDQYAVLVVPDQPLTDDEQCVFSRNFGELEATLIGQMTKPEERRLARSRWATSPTSTPAGNLRGARRQPADVRAWATVCGTPTPRSGQPAPAIHCCRPAWCRAAGGNTEFADMRAAYDALDEATKAEIEDLITEHSIAFSRAELGFDDYGAGNEDKMRPVRHRLVRTHPVTGRKSLYLSAHIGTHRRLADARGAGLHPRPDRARHAAAVRPRA